MSVTSADRLQEERNFADASAEATLERDALARWNECQSTHRFFAFVNKRLVAYRLLFGKPSVISQYTCTSVQLSDRHGLASKWQTQDGKLFNIGSVPQEVAEGCFLWLPKYSSVVLQDRRDKPETTVWFSAHYRTRMNPRKQVDGFVYLLEKNAFDSHNWNE